VEIQTYWDSYKPSHSFAYGKGNENIDPTEQLRQKRRENYHHRKAKPKVSISSESNCNGEAFF
jgi:hypothetical protein